MQPDDGQAYWTILIADTGAKSNLPVLAFQAIGRSQKASSAKVAAGFLPQFMPETESHNFASVPAPWICAS